MKKAMRAAGCIITVILTIGLLMWTSNLTVRKDSSDKYSDFFRDRDYDVLFMGTSHVIDSVFPMELWKEYGIVSYNCGGTSNYLPTTYWVLQNVLDYVTPKVVVIDCYRLADDEKCPIIERAHYSLDSFPLSMNKIKAVLDLMDDPGGKTAEQAEKAANIAQSPSLELLWNFAFYHSRWNELEKDDFSPTSTKEKGAEPQINVVRGKLKRIDRDLTSEAGHTGEVYLRRRNTKSRMSISWSMTISSTTRRTCMTAILISMSPAQGKSHPGSAGSSWSSTAFRIKETIRRIPTGKRTTGNMRQ